MTLQHLPTLILGLTVTAYWLYVARMVRRVRQNAGHVRKVLIPAQRREKLMWIAASKNMVGQGRTTTEHNMSRMLRA